MAEKDPSFSDSNPETLAVAGIIGEPDPDPVPFIGAMAEYLDIKPGDPVGPLPGQDIVIRAPRPQA